MQQPLLQGNLGADLRPDLAKRIEYLHKRLETLRAQRQEIDTQMENLSRSIRVISEMMAVEADLRGEPMTRGTSQAKGRLLSMGIREVVATLREESPDITKEEIKARLESIGYDFQGKRPGNAIHMAWISLDRQQNGRDQG